MTETIHLTTDEYQQLLAAAWSQGYAAGWKDQECDFPPHTTDNPWTPATEEDGR